VGGGKVALRKIELLRRFGAYITCVSPELAPGVERLKSARKIRHIKRAYSKKALLGSYKLVIAATNNITLNKRIAKDCRGKGVLVNVVNKRAGADVTMPAILKKRGLLIAVSTDGKDCSRAKGVKDRLRDVV
jgi:siroheme synthase-like protein